MITFGVQKKRCMRKAQMLGIQYERYLEELEKSAQADERDDPEAHSLLGLFGA